MHAFAQQPTQAHKAAGTSRAPLTLAPVPPTHHRPHVSELLRSSVGLRDMPAPGARVIQRKAAINAPGDEYEQEADLIAEQVMRTVEPGAPGACACGGTCPTCRAKHSAPQHRRVQMKRAASAGSAQTFAPPGVDAVLRSAGQPLDPATRAFMEPRFGTDFSQVRVHTDAAAQQSARDVKAIAYTAGQNIVFGTGRFAPESQEGRRLLAHELTHVVQQSAQGSGQIVQRQMCRDILDAEEVPGMTRGVEVERQVRVELISLLGGQNIIPPLPIPGASSRKYRMEDCGGAPSPAGAPRHSGFGFQAIPTGSYSGVGRGEDWHVAVLTSGGGTS